MANNHINTSNEGIHMRKWQCLFITYLLLCSGCHQSSPDPVLPVDLTGSRQLREQYLFYTAGSINCSQRNEIENDCEHGEPVRPAACFPSCVIEIFLAILRIRTSWEQPNHVGNAEICTLGLFRGVLPTPDRAASASFTLSQAQLQQTQATPAS